MTLRIMAICPEEIKESNDYNIGKYVGVINPNNQERTSCGKIVRLFSYSWEDYKTDKGMIIRKSVLEDSKGPYRKFDNEKDLTKFLEGQD